MFFGPDYSIIQPESDPDYVAGFPPANNVKTPGKAAFPGLVFTWNSVVFDY